MAIDGRGQKTDVRWTHYLDKVGVGGSLFAALCCLGFPALLSLLLAVGLGFLIKDAVLIPLLVAFLVVALVGLARGMRHHHRAWALILGAAGAIVTFVSVGIKPSGLFAGIGIAGLIVASLLNIWLQSQQLRR